MEWSGRSRHCGGKHWGGHICFQSHRSSNICGTAMRTGCQWSESQRRLESLWEETCGLVAWPSLSPFYSSWCQVQVNLLLQELKDHILQCVSFFIVFLESKGIWDYVVDKPSLAIAPNILWSSSSPCWALLHSECDCQWQLLRVTPGHPGEWKRKSGVETRGVTPDDQGKGWSQDTKDRR